MKTTPLIIRLAPDAAAVLAALRLPGESWSDVVLRCAKTEAEANASVDPAVCWERNQPVTR